MRLSDLAGKRVVIWGAGREGRASVDAIGRLVGDVHVQVVDDSPDGPRDVNGTPVLRGEAGRSALSAAEVVVRSPGISRYRTDVVDLASRGVQMTSATDLWLSENPRNVIGITGTKGKSTTASMIGAMLQAVGKSVEVVGNIGKPPIDLLGRSNPDWWVLEASSHQTSDVSVSPDIGVLTTLSPEHLDWHGDEATYYADKLNLFAHKPSATVVVNALDNRAANAGTTLPASVVGAGLPPSVRMEGGAFATAAGALFPLDSCRLPGVHNRVLTCLALAVLDAAGVDVHAFSSELQRALQDFESLPHRLQPVADVNGITYVDDSIATVPTATMAALDAFDGRDVTLLVGGFDRGIDYTEFAAYLAKRRAPLRVITLPDSGPRIARVIRDATDHDVREAPDLTSAVAVAKTCTPSGGVVLLSPAAPSFGHFVNYGARGDAFRDAAIASS